MLLEYALVFIGAAIPWMEIALVIPVGIVWGLSPFLVMLLAFVGNLITVVPLIIGFEKVKSWFAKRRRKKEKQPSKRTDRGKKIWNKYGLPGLALLGPILTGTHIAAFIGMSLGAKKQWVMLWMTVSIGLWTIIIGVATVMGLDIFVQK
ncbi:DNA-binding protein [Virgibacillus profundi]|uniref:DNA-binding protein n=1 Tax=Virgibacillus profundi TaxID=2024555 RepID=A0A2A2IK91_9BACI|nr:small multi-drug export protein [Virgibacillus profundi]PAV31570.1 DNA-binding protein [Virgibacillus profundi]PXY55756.1 DNA-binding protein [Virgibacillus profundi]